MRDLTATELQTVSGAAVAPVPRVPTTLFGVKLSRTDQAALAAVLGLFRPRK